MFTGLVQGLGTVSRATADAQGVRLEVSTPLGAELAEGDSVAVNGVCLTATDVRPDGFRADVMAETLRRSSLGPVGTGDSVNLELPLRAGDRLGGHIVQGHVDGTGTVTTTVDEGMSRLITVGAGPDVLRYVVEKGSIAVDGVSL